MDKAKIAKLLKDREVLGALWLILETALDEDTDPRKLQIFQDALDDAHQRVCTDGREVEELYKAFVKQLKTKVG